jgi:hypothetical protein
MGESREYFMVRTNEIHQNYRDACQAMDIQAGVSQESFASQVAKFEETLSQNWDEVQRGQLRLTTLPCGARIAHAFFFCFGKKKYWFARRPQKILQFQAISSDGEWSQVPEDVMISDTDASILWIPTGR